jgi:uncharacterized MAPEG superfamily protein
MEFWILAGLGLYLVNVHLAGFLLMAQVGPLTHSGPRDSLPEPGRYRARALRAAENFAENLPVFVTLGLLALIVEGAEMGQAVLGAQIFVLSRVVYIAVYVAGVPIVRSLVFMAGVIGLLLMALALF